MTDPYIVLGISKNASEEEIKNAYRELAKKYHPDNYADTPMSEFANEKMKEINDAYDSIMNERRHGQKNTSSSGSSYNRSTGEYTVMRTLIRQGRLDEAEAILERVQVQNRSAEWYFLKGSISYSRGWLDDAEKNFARANRMEPNNGEYAAAYNRVLGQKRGNYGGYQTTNNPMMGTNGCTCSGCDICTSLMCADCCCECMGGDFIRCC